MSDIRLRVSHEALLTHWDRAKTQIKEDKGLLEVRRRVETDMQRWLEEKDDKKKSSLLLPSGLRLEEANKLLKEWKNEFGTEDQIRKYIEESNAARKRRIQKQKERQKKLGRVEAEAKYHKMEADHNSGLGVYERSKIAQQKFLHNVKFLCELRALIITKPDWSERPVCIWSLHNTYFMPLAFIISCYIFRHHARIITSVTFSNDGTILASSSKDHTIRLWEVTTGQLLATLTLDGYNVTAKRIIFSPNGTMLASVSHDGYIRLWEVATRRLIRVLEEHTHWVCIAFSPKGSILATGARGNSIHLWEVATGRLIRTIEGMSHYVTSVVFSPDGITLASGSIDGIRIWEVATGKLIATLKSHAGKITNIAFASDSITLASGSDDRIIRVWDAATGHLLAILGGYSGSITNIAFSHDGTTLASISDDKTIRVWEVATYNLIGTTSLESAKNITSIAHAFDGTILVSGSDEKHIRVWKVGTDQILAAPYEYPKQISSIAFSPNGATMALGASNGTIQVWDVVTGRLRMTIDGHLEKVTKITFTLDSTILASGSYDGIRLWEVASGQLLATLDGYSIFGSVFDRGKINDEKNRHSITDIAFTHNGTSLTLVSSNGKILAWKIAIDEVKRLDKYQNEDIDENLGDYEKDYEELISIFAPNRLMIATAALGTSNGSIIVLEATTSKLLATLHSNSVIVISFAFSPDSTILAAGYINGTVHIWEIDTGQILKTLKWHEDWVTGLAFTSDGTMLASVFHSRRAVLVWEVATGNLLSVVEEHCKVNEVAFTPDDMTIISRLDDGTIIMREWNIDMSRHTAPPQKHTGALLDVVFSPNGTTLAKLFNNGVISLWETTTNRLSATLHCSGIVTNIAFAADGMTLASGMVMDGGVYDSDNIQVWDVATGQLLATLKLQQKNITSFALAPRRTTLATGLDNGTIRLWDVATGRRLMIIKKHLNGITGIIFAVDGKTLASISEKDSTVQMWDVATGTQLWEKSLQREIRNGYRIAFSSNSTALALGTNGNIWIWEVVTGKEQAILSVKSEDVDSIAFSPDSKFLASCGQNRAEWSKDNVIRLWAVNTGQLLVTLLNNSEHYGKAIVGFSNDNTALLVASIWEICNDIVDYSALNLSLLTQEITTKRLSHWEQRLSLRFDGLDCIPSQPRPNLYGHTKAIWSEKHPNHWLPAAESGDTRSMVQIGLIYDLAHNYELAIKWYRQAAAVGDKEGIKRLEFLENWLKRQETASTTSHGE